MTWPGLMAAGLLLTVSACGGSETGDGDSSRLAGLQLYVNPEGHAVQQAETWARENRPDLVELIEPLAQQPVATWFTGDQGDPYLEARALTRAAERAGRVALLTVYNLPNRDCGQYSAGGASDIDTYLSWLGSLAAGIEDRDVVVVLEPDAVPHAIEGCFDSAESTYALLAEAVRILKRQPGAHVYLDAGNSSWVDDVDVLAAALRTSGVDEADGFSLNVSNFETTEESVDYGQRLSEQLGGARFVIDTGRNGAGAPPGSGTGAQSSWCNPPEARLGVAPDTDPGLDGVDALLWIKQPGDSDGECRPGDPPAGTFDTGLAGALLDQPLPY